MPIESTALATAVDMTFGLLGLLAGVGRFNGQSMLMNYITA
jgi:hypothetical protein